MVQGVCVHLKVISEKWGVRTRGSATKRNADRHYAMYQEYIGPISNFAMYSWNSQLITRIIINY